MAKTKRYVKMAEILRNEPNLCGGGTLKAIVFCCGLEKPCPIRNTALKILNIPLSVYKKIKDENGIKAEGVCFGNIAYCCSLKKPCPYRNQALTELGMSEEDYLEFKARLLERFMEYNDDDEVWNQRVMKKYVFIMVDPETKISYKGVGIGNPELSIFNILKIVEKKKVEF